MNKEQKEKQRERSRKYYYEHKKEVLARQKAYVKERYKTDEEYRQRVLDKNKKYEEEHYDKIKESKRKAQAKYMMKKRENGEAPVTKNMIINDLQQENEKLKERINKAINYIEKNSFDKQEKPMIWVRVFKNDLHGYANELLEILKGDSNEKDK